ncbi:MAG: hypothetical protein IJ509_03745 [Bacilli bacterium]|nr:hypothetical protein [Bacilli bacterium]
MEGEVVLSKRSKKIILGIILGVVTLLYSYYFRPIVDDELFNFGFAYNIMNGLVPYKDFNMIIPPLFSYILAGILKIFGAKLIVYHIVIVLIILLIFFISYSAIGNKAFMIYLLMLIYPYTGYNMFCMGLLFILLYLEENKKNRNGKKLTQKSKIKIKNDIIEPIIISMMFLSKQTLGLLVIPSIIFSKNKKKTISIYLLAIFGFLLYLILTGSLVEFFDYCLFGMFDFADKNSSAVRVLAVVEILIIIILGYFSFTTKRKDLFFCLVFQVVALPIVDYVHFMISFIPVVYLLLKKIKNIPFVTLFGSSLIGSFFIAFNILVFITKDNYLFLGHYDVNNFMKGRVTYNLTEGYVFRAKEYLDKYEDYRPFILGHFSYLIKLNNNMPINKFDLINEGNMGYNGTQKYIDEIDNYCKEEKCVFIINDNESDVVDIQTSGEILDYVSNNYRQVYCSSTFSVYINR